MGVGGTRKWMSMAVEADVRQQLVTDLRVQVRLLERDLRERAEEVEATAQRLRAEYVTARGTDRTAMGFTEWREGRILQAAAAVRAEHGVRPIP